MGTGKPQILPSWERVWPPDRPQNSDLDSDNAVALDEKGKGKVTRCYLELQPFKFCVQHKTGKENITAEYLSRLPNICDAGEEGSNVTKMLSLL